MNDYFEVYREARGRIVGLVRGCSAEQRARTVPGCPRWTVADTVAHLAAVAVDVVAGALTGVPGEEHTAAQVAQRRGSTLEEVIAEWDEACGQLAGWGSSEGPIEQALAARRLPSAMVHDVLTHEADIRGALEAGRPPDSAWGASLALMLRHPERLGTVGRLTVRTGPHEFTVGSGEPAATLEVDPYEFWRAQVGRRSRAQMAAWRWSGNPAPYLRAIPVFGPTETDLAEPVSPV
ncbi:MAG: maleylpyruvate isomerase family mycothiol-dependent enzyme [Pseudonocardiaceae bacterium]